MKAVILFHLTHFKFKNVVLKICFQSYVWDKWSYYKQVPSHCTTDFVHKFFLSFSLKTFSRLATHEVSWHLSILYVCCHIRSSSSFLKELCPWTTFFLCYSRFLSVSRNGNMADHINKSLCMRTADVLQYATYPPPYIWLAVMVALRVACYCDVRPT
jgi:hypothetical protein